MNYWEKIDSGCSSGQCGALWQEPLPSGGEYNEHRAPGYGAVPRPAPAARPERGAEPGHTPLPANPPQTAAREKQETPRRPGRRDGGAAQHGNPGPRGASRAPSCAGPARPYLVPVVSGQLGLGEEPHGGLGRRPEAQLGLGAGGGRRQEEQQERQQGGQREPGPGRRARHGAERAPPPARPGPAGNGVGPELKEPFGALRNSRQGSHSAEGHEGAQPGEKEALRAACPAPRPGKGRSQGGPAPAPHG